MSLWSNGWKVICIRKIGERFAVRNSGATAVTEGAGDHCCEYMTGGKVVILGSTGRNIGAGMTGGIAFILDENNDLSNKVNKEIVSIHKITSSKQEDILLEIIREYRAKTNSLKAARIIENWSDFKSNFKLIVPPSEEEMLGIKKM